MNVLRIQTHIVFFTIKISRTIILPVVLYRCDAWSLTVTEQCRLRAFENRMLSKTFGPKKYKVTGEWRKLHNQKLIDLSSPNIILVMKCVGNVAHIGGERCTQGFGGES